MAKKLISKVEFQRKITGHTEVMQSFLAARTERRDAFRAAAASRDPLVQRLVAAVRAQEEAARNLEASEKALKESVKVLDVEPGKELDFGDGFGLRPNPRGFVDYEVVKAACPDFTAKFPGMVKIDLDTFRSSCEGGAFRAVFGDEMAEKLAKALKKQFVAPSLSIPPLPDNLEF